MKHLNFIRRHSRLHTFDVKPKRIYLDLLDTQQKKKKNRKLKFKKAHFLWILLREIKMGNKEYTVIRLSLNTQRSFKTWWKHFGRRKRKRRIRQTQRWTIISLFIYLPFSFYSKLLNFQNFVQNSSRKTLL